MKKQPKHRKPFTQAMAPKSSRTAAPVDAVDAAVPARGKYTLGELLSQMPEGAPIDLEWEMMRPVGREIIG